MTVIQTNQAIIPDVFPQVGDQFDRYQVRAPLAQGGMGSIFRAVDLISGAEVVIKFPDPTMIGDPAQFERFQRELEVMKTLKHPAIQRGLASGTYNRLPFLVTELVEGRSLRDVISAAGPGSVEETTNLVRKIGEAVAYCHANGVIHRDLKPENILITESGQPVIIDFGLALTKSAHRVTYSNLSSAAGTPEYMAPEQVEGHRGDARTDLYAVGVMFFELLTGQPPYGGDTPLAIMAQHTQAPVPRVDKVRPDVPLPVAAIVTRCLQKDPEHRFSDLDGLLAALEHPEAVDLSVLETGTGAVTAVPFWRSQQAFVIGMTILAGVLVVALAFALQALRPH